MGVDSELVSLVGGRGGPLWLNRPERQLLKFALDAFGEPLSRFLLAGLGEEPVGWRWHFTVTWFSGTEAYDGRLQILTHDSQDGQSLLPRQRDPLALLALLWLSLRGSHDAGTILTYKTGDVLRLLGWPDDEGGRDVVDGAVGRYSYLMYKWEIRGGDVTHRGASLVNGREQLLSSYRTTDKAEVDNAGQERRVYNQVTFNTFFVEGLRRRALLGVAWDNVSSLDRL